MSMPVPPTKSRLIIKRGGKQISGKVPKPVVLVDSREQMPLDLARFDNWFAGEKRVALETGDYSLEGLEHLVSYERKSLQDVVGTLCHSRERFIREMERLATFKYKGIIIEADYSTLKTPYSFYSLVEAHPNGICGSLDAIEIKYGVPITYASSNRLLVEEKLGSLLSKIWNYEWLEQAGLGRVLVEGDL